MAKNYETENSSKNKNNTGAAGRNSAGTSNKNAYGNDMKSGSVRNCGNDMKSDMKSRNRMADESDKAK